MNIYLLHIGYIIGCLALSFAITFIYDIYVLDERLIDDRSAIPILSFLGLVFTILMLLSYY